jgi:signal transduction histidine kinase
MIANLLENEEKRLQELSKYEILDTLREQEFDDVVKLASQVCQVPISLITLIDNCRQWFKAKVGIEDGFNETSRDIAFCAHTIHFNEMLEVEDMLKDKRFADNPLVLRKPKIRFYAGVPLQTPSGHKLGTLCVLDTKPRKLTQDQRFALETLARQVEQQFELKLKNKKLMKLAQQYLGFYEKVKVEHEALTKVQEAAEIGTYEINLQTGGMKISDGFCKLFGLPPREGFSIGEMLQLVYPPDVPHFKDSFNRSLEQQRFSYEFRCVRPSTQELIYIKCMGETLRDREEEPYKLLGLKQNITNIKENEVRLAEQNRELKKLNEELDNFVYRVSHDLRAPNSSILGLIDIILHQEEEPERIKELLLLIQKSLRKQDDFIRDILNYSKNARLALQVESVDFQKMLDSIFSQLLYSYTAEDIRKHIEIDQEAPFATDKIRLNMILNNLISNALKYIKPGATDGSVSVAVKAIASEAIITIEDNGMGIEEEYQDRIFEMFYRATDQKPGSGLGLYIVKEAVQKLGGEVNLRSKGGNGTLVSVRIPNLQ